MSELLTQNLTDLSMCTKCATGEQVPFARYDVDVFADRSHCMTCPLQQRRTWTSIAAKAVPPIRRLCVNHLATPALKALTDHSDTRKA